MSDFKSIYFNNEEFQIQLKIDVSRTYLLSDEIDTCLFINNLTTNTGIWFPLIKSNNFLKVKWERFPEIMHRVPIPIKSYIDRMFKLAIFL